MDRIRNIGVAILLSAAAFGQSPLGTAFTYQGQLKQAGVPLNDTADFQFGLWDAATGGGQVGETLAANAVAVENGLFSVQLNFGNIAFSGDARWLEIAVRAPSGFGPFTVLSPRQPLTAAPYALYALDGPGSPGFWAASGVDIYNTNSGRVGIGTTAPNGTLEVYNQGGTHALWVTSAWIPVYAKRESTTGTWPAVHGECSSAASGTSALRGLVTNANPGNLAAGVYGACQTADAAADDAVGVRGQHAGGGSGVYGQSVSGAGVYGTSTDGPAVRGVSQNATGVWGDTSGASAFAGYFSGGSGVKVLGLTEDGARLQLHGGVDSMFERLGTVAFQDFWGIEKARLECRNTLFGHYLALNMGGQDRIRIGELGSIEILPSAGGILVVDGTARVDVLEIAGADVAEQFPVSEAAEPGMVVAIDPEHPGQLCLARGKYNRCVAGVVSGANGLSVGAVLGHVSGREDGVPIALTGRVWVYCDTSAGAIRPGDLLTTADVPGHAMKVTDHARAQGAIIGKAMTALEEGRGLVLVLVSLQ